MRILALSAAAAEILQAIGLGDALLETAHVGGARVGVVSREGWDADARRLAESVAALRPDLILVDDADNGAARRLLRRAAARLRPRPPVYALAPRTVGDILSDVKTIGDATGRQAQARDLIAALRQRIDAATLRVAGAIPRPAALLASFDPPCAAGWWQAELLGLAGGLDVLDGVGRPPRPVTWREVAAGAPDIVVVTDSTTRLHTGAPAPTDSGVPARVAPGLLDPGTGPRTSLPLYFPTDARPFRVAGPRIADALEAVALLLHPALGDPAGNCEGFLSIRTDA